MKRQLLPDEVCSMNLDEIRTLRAEDFGRELTLREFNHVLGECDAMWLHSGNRRDPHAVTTKGQCTDGFIDTLRALKFTNVCQIMAKQIVSRIPSTYNGGIDWVIGSDHAGATLSYAVASLLGAQHDFTEKGPDKTQIWKRFEIKPNEMVLQVEELITTRSTLEAVRAGVRAGNSTPVRFVPFSIALVHRSDHYEMEGEPIHFAYHYNIQTWPPAECPWCAQGSERLLPKKNWAKLTSKV